MKLITTFEYAYLTAQHFSHPPDFDWLLEQELACFHPQRKNGVWQIQVRHYLGVIQLPSGQALEILPKIAKNTPDNLCQTRQWVQTMLTDIWQQLSPRQLPHFSPITPTQIQPELPLSDWLLKHFFQLLQNYQPNRYYQTYEQNQSVLQGKLLIKEHMSQNSHQPHKFYQQTDTLLPNTVLNRLIKTAWQRLSQIAPSPVAVNPRQWQSIASLLPNQIDTPFYNNLIQQIGTEIQQFPTHQQADIRQLVGYCRWLIEPKSSGISGEKIGQAMLINMQTAFEKWVTSRLKHQIEAGEITDFAVDSQVLSQPSQPLLFDEHRKSLLTISPDIVVVDSKIITVMDIKWKNFTGIQTIKNSDIYQILAYAEHYRQINQTVKAWLIYPATTIFYQPLHLYTHQQQIAISLVPFCVQQRQLLLAKSEIF